mmetsp:Transcript_71305/g.231765  ORF Transcript_71305/g.231765 Transcript_71305/m.231765 type:complete len:81 (-) Transcript_71305:63-305(-)
MRMVPATHLHSMGPMGLGGRWRRWLRLMKSGAGQTQVENSGSQRCPKRLIGVADPGQELCCARGCPRAYVRVAEPVNLGH